MLLILYTNFFLCLIVAVNHGDAADAGDACSVAGGCNGDLLCDKIHNKCLIKVTASCTGNTDKCVSHASCGANSECACDTGYTVNTGLCEANIGTACNTSVGCFTNSLCDNVFGKCLIKVTASCVGNTDKCVSHASCGAGNLCVCDTGYTDNTGLCKANLGTVCNASVSCVPSYVCDLSGKCLIKAGASCASNIDKCVTNAACSEAGSTCGCNNGYTANDEGLCALNNTGKTPGITMSALVAMLLCGMCFSVLMM